MTTVVTLPPLSLFLAGNLGPAFLTTGSGPGPRLLATGSGPGPRLLGNWIRPWALLQTPGGHQSFANQYHQSTYRCCGLNTCKWYAKCS